MAYVVVLFLTSTVCFIAHLIGEPWFILERFEPAYEADAIFRVFLALLVFQADSLLIWRCAGIHNTKAASNFRYSFVLFILCGTTLAVLGCGLYFAALEFQLSEDHEPSSNGWTNITAYFAFWDLSLLNNVIITGMILFRLRSQQRYITPILGKGHGFLYNHIMAMLLESAALIVGVDLLIVGLSALDFQQDSISSIFVYASPNIYVLAVLLVFYRVSVGKSWSSDVVGSELRFQNSARVGT